MSDFIASDAGLCPCVQVGRQRAADRFSSATLDAMRFVQVNDLRRCHRDVGHMVSQDLVVVGFLRSISW